jgi:hypothetical protein
MRLAASSAPVAVKRRAVYRWTELKIFVYLTGPDVDIENYLKYLIPSPNKM